MHAKKPEQSKKVTIRNMGNIVFHADLLAKFRAEHGDWLDRLQEDAPVYCLSKKCIQGLRHPVGNASPVLNDKEAATEAAFTDMCRSGLAIGFWRDLPVSIAYLNKKAPLRPDEKLLALNWTYAEICQAKQLMEQTDSAASRLKGYMGWLITDPEFIQARDELAERWMALDKASRPFRIVRSIRVREEPKGMKLDSKIEAQTASFQDDLNDFLDHWGLVGMETWDLPEPQGPLLPASVSNSAQAMPKHGLHIVLPVHYPLTGADDLLRQIQKLQASIAEEAGLDPSLAGLKHYEAYARMFDVAFLEETIRSRYDKKGRKKGLITAMEHTIAETLGISSNQVQKYRKAISSCRRGKRASVGWLNSRS